MAGLSDTRDVIRGAIASLFGFGGRLIARAILMVVASRAYGIEALGHLGQVAAITEITAAICIIGLKRSLLDMLSHQTEKGRNVERRIIEALGVTFILGCIISAILTFVWAILFPDQHHLLPFLFLGVPAIIFTDVCLTAIKFKRIIKWDVLSRCVFEPWFFLCVAVVLFYYNRIDDGLIFAYVGSVVIAAACAGWGLIHVYGCKKLLISKPRIANWLGIIKQSVPVGITDVGVMSLRRLDLIVLSIFVGPEGAGLYYMVQQIATIPQKVNGLFEPMMSPVIARLHNQMDTSRIRANLISVCRWVFIIQLGLTIPMVVFGEAFLGLFGPKFQTGYIVFAVILLAELIDGSFATAETPLVYAKPKIPPSLLVMTLIVEVILIAMFSKIWGVEGAAIGFLCAITSLAIGRLYMLQRHMDINILNIT